MLSTCLHRCIVSLVCLPRCRRGQADADAVTLYIYSTGYTAVPPVHTKKIDRGRLTRQGRKKKGMKRRILAAVFFFLLLSAMAMALPVAAAAVDVEHTFVVAVYIYIHICMHTVCCEQDNACMLIIIDPCMHRRRRYNATQVSQAVVMTHLCEETPVTVVNGQLPGPAIEVTEGDSVAVHIINKSPYNMTIHWYVCIYCTARLYVVVFLLMHEVMNDWRKST